MTTIKINPDVQKKIDELHMAEAFDIAKRSPDNRKQVGCVIICGSKRVSTGINSKPFNVEDYDSCVDEVTGKSHPTLIHAEEQAMLRDRTDIDGKTLYCTSCPCLRCAARIIHHGTIKRVVFVQDHDNNESVDYLRKNGIKADKMEFTPNETDPTT